MTTQTTLPLSVASCTHSLGPPRKITFHFTRAYPPPLYLGILTITEDSTIQGVSGTIVPGTPTRAGTADIRMGTGLFGPLFNYVSMHSGLSVQIRYEDTTFQVDAVFCSSTTLQLATEATVSDIKASLGEGNITAGLDALNQTAQSLLKAIHHVTQLLSNQHRAPDSEPPASADSDLPPSLEPESRAIDS
jgi:hypothetical protein